MTPYVVFFVLLSGIFWILAIVIKINLDKRFIRKNIENYKCNKCGNCLSQRSLYFEQRKRIKKFRSYRKDLPQGTRVDIWLPDSICDNCGNEHKIDVKNGKLMIANWPV